MKKLTKTSIISLAAIALLGTGVATGYAASDWAGHQNILAININLDKLANKIKSQQSALDQAKSDLANANNGQQQLKDQLTQQQAAYDVLNKQRNDDATSFQQQLQAKQGEIQQKIVEIQQKIDEGNQKVADKQKEVDGLNGKINDLNNQLAAQKQSSDDDMAQAVKDVQDTKSKSDQLVNQYVGN